MNRLARLLFVLASISGSGKAQQYWISTYAGGAPLPVPLAAWDMSIATDFTGSAFFTSRHSVFKRDTVAGNGRRGFSGDGGPVTDAELTRPLDVAVNASGNLLIIDDLRVRKFSNDRIIATIAGNGACCFSLDGGPADATALLATAIAGDGAGNIYVIDPMSNAVRILRPGPMK